MLTAAATEENADPGFTHRTYFKTIGLESRNPVLNLGLDVPAICGLYTLGILEIQEPYYGCDITGHWTRRKRHTSVVKAAASAQHALE